MPPRISIDDSSLNALQQTGELHVLSASGLPLVVMTASAHEQLQKLAYDAGAMDVDTLLPLAHEAFADAWNASGMDAYDDYDAHRSAMS